MNLVVMADDFQPGLFLDAGRFLWDDRGLLGDKVLEHLALSGAALAVAILVALPLGVALGHFHRGAYLAVTASNVGRALPTLAVIAIGIAFLGVGFLNVMVALTVLAVPPVLTNAYVGVDGVDREVVEAARGMGMTRRQVLLRVELPLAAPLVFGGIRTATVIVVASATIAAVAGGGGLGDVIVDQSSYRLEGVVAASLVVSVLAFAADGAVALVQRLLTPAPVRASASREYET